MRLAITGHRPNKIPDLGWASRMISEAYDELKPTVVIQGMASGIDLLAGQIAVEKHIALVCVRPWAGHTADSRDMVLYQTLMDAAHEVVVLDQRVEYPGPWVYHNRNRWMVDRAHALLAFYDGSPGGTHGTYSYAMARRVPIYQINPASEQISCWGDWSSG